MAYYLLKKERAQNKWDRVKKSAKENDLSLTYADQYYILNG